MSDGERPLIRRDVPSTVLQVVGGLMSAAPWVGGPVSAILNGIASGRATARVQEVLDGLGEDLRGLRTEVSEQYLLSSAFADILERRKWRSS